MCFPAEVHGPHISSSSSITTTGSSTTKNYARVYDVSAPGISMLCFDKYTQTRIMYRQTSNISRTKP